LTDPPSNNNDVDKALLQRLPEVQQRLFVLFSNYRDFNSFGNKAWASSQNLSSWDSIESVHDIIHIYGGLRGHMTYVPLSSFDPLFFMHHVSMDRYTAIWQILNPSAWISPMPAGETSYTTLKGDIQTSKTALTPFYISEDGTFWDSDMARDTTTFGYTYADTDSTLVAVEDLKESLIRKINRWWGRSGVMGLRSYRTNTARPYPPGGWGMMGGPKSYGQLQNSGGASRAHLMENIVMDGRYTEWIANVGVNAEALGGSFTVHFFLGSPPTSCYHVSSPRNEVGSVSIFAMNMQTGSQSRVSGTLPLTSTLIQLVDSGTIANLMAGTVVPFLQKELSFAICDMDNIKTEHELVDGLHIGIVSAEVEVPNTDGELPRWGTTVSRLVLWS
jgi:tyrosinase